MTRLFDDAFDEADDQTEPDCGYDEWLDRVQETSWQKFQNYLAKGEPDGCYYCGSDSHRSTDCPKYTYAL